MSFGDLERSTSYGGNLRFHRALVLNPLSWDVFIQNDFKFFNQDLVKNLLHQNKLSFENMFKD